MSDSTSVLDSNDQKPAKTVPGVVEKIIKPFFPGDPEKAEISLDTADPLYREIRIENTLTNADGELVSLKKGAQVDVTIQADEKDTVKKTE
jgi:hypothetical protein